MKKLYNKLVYRLARICYSNVFGQISNVLLFGGALLACCGAAPAGIGCLAFAGLGYLLSVGKIALEDHQAEQEKKYFTEEDYEAEDYAPEKNNEATEEKVEETVEEKADESVEETVEEKTEKKAEEELQK